MPPKVQQSNAKHYKSDTITEVKEYDGRPPAARPATAGRGRRCALEWATEKAAAAPLTTSASPTSAARPS